MIPRIKSVKPLKDCILYVVFDNGRAVYYDVKEDINTIEDFQDLESIKGLFAQVQLDESRTCIFWNDRIDLPSDAIYECGEDEPEQDEIESIERANKSIAESGTVSHDEIDWD